MIDQLEGRVAFITGGAQGIGLGIARACAAAGVKVALADIDEMALAKAAEDLAATTTVATFVLDVRDRDRYEQVAVDVERELGPVSLLFNNAGVAGRAPVAETKYAMWDWVIGINLGGVINGIQTFLPRMLGRGPGHIVNTASGAGLAIPGPGGGAGFLYHTSKYAVVGMSESLHDELEPLGIGVSVLCPGPVATNIQDTTPRTRPGDGSAPAPEAVTQRKKFLAMGADPNDVGRAVLDAVSRNQLFIHTDRLMESFVRQRCAAILETMPAVS